MSNSNCPCKECVPPKRFPGCHGVCPEYIAWSKKHIRHCMAVRASKEKERAYLGYLVPELEKNAKKRHEIEKLRK